MGGKGHKNFREEALKRVLDLEGIEGVVEPRVPPDARYKSRGFEELSLPDLKIGGAAVVRKTAFRGEVIGYLGGIVLDYDDEGEEKGFWGRNTEIIMQVVAVSNPSLSRYLGRLICCSYASRSWARTRFGGLGIVGFGRESWDDYKIFLR
jgi:hypothetical protein